MPTKRAGRRKRRFWSKADVRELKAHSRSKSPVIEIAKGMKRSALGPSGVRGPCSCHHEAYTIAAHGADYAMPNLLNRRCIHQLGVDGR